MAARGARRLEAWSRAAVAALGLATALCGLRWGLPGAGRLRVLPESLKGPEAARRLEEGWRRLYEGIEKSHRELRGEEPVTYAEGVEEIPPGWVWPPDKLLNSYRSFLLRTGHPDESKPFIVLSRMRPWSLEFQPLYVQYGGAFIYPLGAFLLLGSWLGALTVVPGLGHYLLNPDDLRRLFLAGRLFVALFHLGSLALLWDLGRRLSGWRSGALAAALFALCPFALSTAHTLKPHACTAFWFLASLRSLLIARESGRRRDFVLCGAFAGLAAGTNLSFFCLGAFPAFALLRGRGRPSRAERSSALLGAAAAAAVAAAANPYLLASFRDYAWELTVYPTAASAGARPATLLSLLGPAASEALGPLLQLAAAVGIAFALIGRGARGLAAGVSAFCGLVVWALLSRAWGFMGGAESLRFFYPLVAVACLLAADWLCAGPGAAALRAVLAAAVLLDTGVRGAAVLQNLRLDDGPRGTRAQAAAWIERNVPAGSGLGLARYPQPAHAPPLRFERYRLVVGAPEALAGPRAPEWLVVDAMDRPAVEKAAAKSYNLVTSFEPARVLWARPMPGGFFANTGFSIYRRGPSQ